MLPDRSKRYAGIDAEVPRLRLIGNWQLALLAVLMLGLLRLIFPQQALFDKLHDQERLDELTLSYIENLYRTQPGNVDLTILLARTRREQLDVEGLERLLAPALQSSDARQRSEARALMLSRYERALAEAVEAREQAQWRERLMELLRTASEDELPSQLASDFAATAFRLQLPQLGLQFLRRVSQEAPVSALVTHAKAALAQGRHALAAEYFMLARQQADSRELARVCFRQGVGALMAASRFEQAMQAADRYLGDLADDPETLRYLTRAALAAGEPKRAAHYAQQLVFAAPPVTGATP